jgi:hypothetical protein
VIPNDISTLRKVMTFGSAVLIATVVACGKGSPAESAAEEAVRARVSDGKFLELRDFHKTDGRDQTVNGVKVYDLMFSADDHFLSNALYQVSNEGMPAGIGPQNGDKISAQDYRDLNREGLNAMFYLSNGMRPALAGDILHLSGAVTFEKRESGWVATAVAFSAQHDSSQRGDVRVSAPAPQATSSPTSAKIAGTDDDSVGARRCNDFLTTNPIPKAPWYDRLMGKTGVARDLPDGPIPLKKGTRVGSIAFLQSGELCVAGKSLKALAENDAPKLTLANSQGLRLLLVQNSQSTGTPFENVVYYAWLVHPDSMRQMSANLFAAYPDIGMSSAHDLGKDSWSPDGKRFIFALTEANFETSLNFPYDAPGVLVAQVPNGDLRFASFRQLSLQPSQFCIISPQIDKGAVQWLASDRIRATLKWPARPPCTERDSSRSIEIDLARGIVGQ